MMQVLQFAPFPTMLDVAASPLSARERFNLFEAELAKNPGAPLKTRHFFSPGMYGREIIIPAGTPLTGKIHREAHINVVSKGRIMVATEGEEGTRVLAAGDTFISQPGTRRAGIALEETVWLCVHPNPDDERDLEKLEARYILPYSNPQIEGGPSWLGSQ